MPKAISSRSRRQTSAQHVEEENPQRVAIGDIPISDRATKRVIAPFVRIIRKGVKIQEAEEAKLFAMYLQRKPSVLIRDLSSFLSDSVDLVSLIHETATVLQVVTKASGVTVYLMDMSTDEIYQSRKTPVSERHKIRWKIKESSIVATYVAKTKQHVMVDDILDDDRFPEGIGYQSDIVKSVLCTPVVTPDGACFAVLELYKLLLDHPFNNDDLKITLIVTGWMGAAIYENSQRLALQRQQELNDYLLDLTKCFFGESVVMEKMISEISKFAQVALNAERSSIFVIDPESGEELVAELFDESFADAATKKPVKVRFAKERGIAGFVARTGVTVNVKDAYEDARFNKEIDQKTGFITRSILCMPIMGVDGILGVVQVVNKKKGGYFSSTDETLFKTFCSYCALALRYNTVRTQLAHTKHLNNCYLKIIQLQVKPCIHDTLYYKRQMHVEVPLDFNYISWYIRDEEHDKMPSLYLYMFSQLVNRWDFDREKTMEFILSLRKFYRNTPFHNFEHAFNVSHTMYLLLRENKDLFTPLELKALIIAALSHDTDHGGCTNSFLEATNDDLANLYETSIWENHHFYVATLILDNSQFLLNMTPEEQKLLHAEIRDAIIATDLLQYFNNRVKLEHIGSRFDWNNPQHKTLLKRIMMTACDLSGVCKPFLVAKRVTDNLYAEFYRQGDLEKDMCLCPLSIMDRDKVHLIPEDQVNFITILALPCYYVLKKHLPHSEPLYKEARFLMRVWQDIIAVRGKKCWRQDDSIVAKRYSY